MSVYVRKIYLKSKSTHSSMLNQPEVNIKNYGQRKELKRGNSKQKFSLAYMYSTSADGLRISLQINRGNKMKQKEHYEKGIYLVPVFDRW